MRRFKAVVAGCSNIAHIWVDYIVSRDDTIIVALVDTNSDKALEFKRKYNIDCVICNDIAEAIKESGANLVLDTTTAADHYRITTTALMHRCDVFGNNPMANSIREAKEMVGLAINTGRNYSVMQNQRYGKSVRAVKELINSGVIGKPGYICADFFMGSHFGIACDEMENPLLFNMSIHAFDLARFFTDSNPISVYCHDFNLQGSRIKGNTSAACIFEMSDGSVFCYRGSMSADGFPSPWQSSWRLVGSKGTALWDGINYPFCEVPVSDKCGVFNFKRTTVTPIWNGREGHIGCFDEMFAALVEGRPAETCCIDNINSIAMAIGAVQSARDQKKISFSCI